MKRFMLLFIVAGFALSQQAIAQEEDPQEPAQKGFDKLIKLIPVHSPLQQ